MATKDFHSEETAVTIEEIPDSSVFACEQCNKMYIHEDALANSMTCCGHRLKELLNETAIR